MSALLQERTTPELEPAAERARRRAYAIVDELLERKFAVDAYAGDLVERELQRIQRAMAAAAAVPATTDTQPKGEP